jgi:hypothetical protein
MQMPTDLVPEPTASDGRRLHAIENPRRSNARCTTRFRRFQKQHFVGSPATSTEVRSADATDQAKYSHVNKVCYPDLSAKRPARNASSTKAMSSITGPSRRHSLHPVTRQRLPCRISFDPFNVHGRGSYGPKPMSAGERRSGQDAHARLAGSRLPPPGWRIEQVVSPFLLRIVGVLDLQPPDARVIGIGKALCDDSFEVVGAHQLEQLSATAVDGNRLGDPRRARRQDHL